MRILGEGVRGGGGRWVRAAIFVGLLSNVGLPVGKGNDWYGYGYAVRGTGFVYIETKSKPVVGRGRAYSTTKNKSRQ
jgi:hypothetical protein